MTHPYPILALRDISKSFFLHLRGGMRLDILRNVTFDVHTGECVVLGGQSGAGKSSLLKMVFGNYAADSGEIIVADGKATTNIVRASPRRILELRRTKLAYVSQFLRVIPRGSAIDIVTDSARDDRSSPEDARQKARAMLDFLNIPERLWSLPPATFSGGEQQRINIARGFVADRSILLLDEPTASLDAANAELALELIRQKKREGVSILAIFHDEKMRDAVADRIIEVAPFNASQNNKDPFSGADAA